MDFDIVELLLIKLFLSKNLQKQSSRGVLKICSKFTGEHPYRSMISIMLRSNFIEITLRHRCSVNLMHIFRTSFPRNTSGRLLLNLYRKIRNKIKEQRESHYVSFHISSYIGKARCLQRVDSLLSSTIYLDPRFFSNTCKANQWAGFYTIGASVMKELFNILKKL